MKVYIFCGRCHDQKRRVVATVGLRDDSTYDVTCSHGHRIHAVFQNQRFELLFDSGALAMRDDYCREAVASFAAALEAFWGFYVRVAALKLGAKTENVVTLRDELKLSERRRGAMNLAHLLLTGQNYAPGDNKERRELGRRTPTKFRNDVVHDGMFPSREETFAYAQYVYDVIRDGIEELQRHADSEAQFEIQAEAGRAHQTLRSRGSDGVVAVGTHEVGTLVGYGVGRKRQTFQRALDLWSEVNVWDLAERETERASPHGGNG